MAKVQTRAALVLFDAEHFGIHAGPQRRQLIFGCGSDEDQDEPVGIFQGGLD